MRTTRIDLSIADWRKSTYSTGGNGCIEITEQFPGVVPVRDSKNPEGPALFFPETAWGSFIKGVKAGEFPIT
ncbi:DUF397 domain-containing protein [Streptomyces sp. LX-29]|uniref:DUF397 domain-containing protein n=1 Tax=Streptomyces sp. LX-29 TaxID=2900152 RepID=UPI00240D9BC2|nr:DUF397 domain-containing protein [Streptomyces sp. LX-29]WFB10390.1 DUF397 domain-containing protein [Streptomyces sp. LX-29]